jgi:integrase
MAGGINKLSAMTVQRTKEPGYYNDGGGLYLQISKLGGKSWVFRFVAPGRPRSEKTGRAPTREMGLGPTHTVSLAEAREKALACRKLVADGQDPVETRKEELMHAQLEAAKIASFATCASAYVKAHQAGWKNEKHGKQWTATLETYAYPVIGSLPVAAVDTGLVLRVLEPIWKTKTETASRLRGRIESILDWATVRGFRHGDNPARWKGHMEHQLPARNKVQKVEHHAALPYAELGVFMAALRQREGISPRALEFAILTAARSGEVRGASWYEIDLQGRLWTIPAERMKAGKEHRVPLSDQAIALIAALPRMAGNDLLFPAPRGKQLSDMALTAVLKRMDRPDLTQHGFRSSFRDWAGEMTAYPREVIEHALAHQLKDKAEAAYQRGDLLAKRARLMADWGKYCDMVPVQHNDVSATKS